MNKSYFIENLAALEELTQNKEKKISKKQYEMFCKNFLFDKIKGKSFGRAFCEKFNFNGIFLNSLSDESAKYHIEKLGYIKK